MEVILQLLLLVPIFCVKIEVLKLYRVVFGAKIAIENFLIRAARFAHNIVRRDFFVKIKVLILEDFVLYSLFVLWSPDDQDKRFGSNFVIAALWKQDFSAGSALFITAMNILPSKMGLVELLCCTQTQTLKNATKIREKRANIYWDIKNWKLLCGSQAKEIKSKVFKVKTSKKNTQE